MSQSPYHSGLKTQVNTVKPDPIFNTAQNLLSNLGKQLGHTIRAPKALAEKMSKGKFQKAVKGFSGMLGKLAKSNIKAWALQKLIELLEPLMKLL